MKSKLLLISILTFAAVIRLINLSNFPSGLNADEAALGYNAYSLMLTGKDEHGASWPVNLESFGDFKPALYAYFLIPFVYFLGLSEIAVRLPSAISGVVLVWLVYLLVRELFTENKYRYLPHFSAAILAISPWAIHFSRGGWEVNLATTMMTLAVWQFLLWQRTGKIANLLIFMLALVASMYTYQSARILAPLLGLVCLLAFYKSNLRKFTHWLITGLFALLLLLPLSVSIITSDAASRFSGVGFLADVGPLNRVKEFRGHHGNANSIIERLLHNRPIIYSLQFIKNYTDHFDGNFLFVNGDVIQRNKIPETGQMYLTDSLFLLLGIIFLLRFPTSQTKIIWLWLGLAPLASALTFQTPHALRAQNMLVPLSILISLGLYYFLNKLSSLSKLKNIRFLSNLGFITVFLLYSYQFSRFIHQYFVHYPADYPSAWEYGFSEAVNYLDQNQELYDKVIFTDKYDQPYILVLFYLKYPPSLFQTNHQLTVRDKFNFSTVKEFDKYTFTSTAWDQIKDKRRVLIFASPDDLPPTGVNIIHTINFPNGQPAFKIVSN